VLFLEFYIHRLVHFAQWTSVTEELSLIKELLLSENVVFEDFSFVLLFYKTFQKQPIIYTLRTSNILQANFPHPRSLPSKIQRF